MLNRVKEAFQEPACEHNQSLNKKGCAKPIPGEAAGGCSFDGAQITLQPIADAAHLVHGPIACAGNSWEARGSLSSGPTLYQYGLTTDMNEHDIIFGSEGKLCEAIEVLVQRFHPPAVFVYATCVTALIGEDLEFVCRKQSNLLGIPIIPVNSPGFVGNKNLGNRLAGEVLLDYVIGTAEPAKTTPWDVNVIGEYNIAGEFWEIHSLFQQAGIRVLSRITGDGRFAEIGWAHRAKVNMVVCSHALISLARKMEERYGIPYFEGAFYGAKETSISLRTIARLLKDDQLEKNISALIRREENKLKQQLQPYKRFLQGKRAVLYTGGVKSWSVITALQELGMEIVGVGTNKSTLDDVFRIKNRVGSEVEFIESGGAGRILKTVKDKRADIVIAGGRNMYTALKEHIPFLDINQERHHAFAGYNGLVRLAKELVFSLNHPVWKIVGKKAPWEEAPFNGDENK
ncbi:nitrogenase molybdenum-cofactor synthesis protein NifE [Evansella caseinilytica]|uniref:Nitrogenase iron-molybdenum cofactor biosynthesis protein NifE n=1 Tax=Evansella caseinilytica TaxID=1503961 RepID=A0A1H3I948_9BACI|nr:nitrogenase iron-molybdenum cofactor biosynthesis protein NifE [Evansella caseinilytica]SDY24246.1 nitrogenase molybdenum-cofactor synthesis protein NifE [Evansella caseinilytica]